MENDEKLKRKYANLLSKLYSINSKLSDVNSSYYDEIKQQKESFLINKDIVDSDIQREANRAIRQVHIELINSVIPIVRDKSY